MDKQPERQPTVPDLRQLLSMGGVSGVGAIIFYVLSYLLGNFVSNDAFGQYQKTQALIEKYREDRLEDIAEDVKKNRELLDELLRKTK